MLSKAPEIVTFFSDLYGAYPFEAAGGIIDPQHDVGYSLEVQTKPVYAYVPDEITVVHELSHMWFGDAVTVKEWPDLWLHEGFATFSEWIWTERHGGPTAQQTFEKRYADNQFPWSPAPNALQRPSQLFSTPVYDRGGMTLQALREKIAEIVQDAPDIATSVERIASQDSVFFSEEFLAERPLMQAIRSDEPVVLLIDEVDRADEALEAVLLETLGEFQISVPEVGTFVAENAPYVILTSNNTRDLAAALKRRCLHLFLDYPSAERELEIVRSKDTGLPEAAARELVGARFMRRVLLVDFDPQGALSVGLGIAPHGLDLSVYNLLMDRGTSIADVVVRTKVPGLDLVPSNIDLSAAEVQLVSEVGREQALLRALRPVLPEYDYVLIDCQPSLGLLTVNALTAAHGVIIPLECEFFSLRGVALLVDTIDKVRDRLNPDLVLDGILATMYDSRTVHCREVFSRVVEAFDDTVFQTVIQRTVRFPETTVAGQPITTWAPTSSGASAYRDLAKEVLAL